MRQLREVVSSRHGPEHRRDEDQHVAGDIGLSGVVAPDDGEVAGEGQPVLGEHQDRAEEERREEGAEHWLILDLADRHLRAVIHFPVEGVGVVWGFWISELTIVLSYFNKR